MEQKDASAQNLFRIKAAALDRRRRFSAGVGVIALCSVAVVVYSSSTTEVDGWEFRFIVLVVGVEAEPSMQGVVEHP